MKKALPNILTISRIALIPGFVIAFYIPGDFGVWMATLIFVAAGITDYLDGYLAREWQAQTSFGKVLDPIADKLLVATAIVMLVHVNRADIIPAVAIICREIAVSGLREHLAEVNVSIPVSRLAKYKTALQMLALFLLIMAPAFDSDIVMTIGRISLWVAAVLTIITAYAYLKQGFKSM